MASQTSGNGDHIASICSSDACMLALKGKLGLTVSFC